MLQQSTQSNNAYQTDWNSFFEKNTVLIPYLDLCVFVVKHLNKLSNSKVVIYEFGCGVGNNLTFLRSLFPDIRLLGSDISQVAINQLISRKIQNSDFWVSDEDLMLSEKGPIDIIVERGALQHTPKEMAKKYIKQIFDAMKSGAVGYFEIASTKHEKFEILGEEGLDKGFGFRTFYTLNDIEKLFQDFSITRIHHLTRELIFDATSDLKQIQGSFQIEIKKK